MLHIFQEEHFKKLDHFLVDNKKYPWYDYEPSAIVPEIKCDHEYFNLLTPFLVSLVMFFVGSREKNLEDVLV